jgi:hypothetical protein
MDHFDGFKNPEKNLIEMQGVDGFNPETLIQWD